LFITDEVAGAVEQGAIAVVANMGVLSDEPAIETENQCNGVFGHINSIGTAVVGNGDAEFSAEIQIHVLITSANELNEFEL
jgi:hypothetical protein